MKKLTIIAALILTACTCFGAGGYKVALVLPFDVGKGGSVKYFDFYCGSYLAAETLCKNGYDITLKPIDCANWAENDTTVLRELEGCDLIIGPVTYNHQKLLQDYSISHEVPIVSPLDTTCVPLVEANPYFFSVPTDKKVQIDNMVNAVSAGGDGDIIVFYNQASPTDVALDEQIENALKEAGLEYTRRSYAITQGRTITGQLKNEMAGGRHKKVIIASEQEAFASDVVRNLALIGNRGTKLSVYGSYKLRTFETIEADHFHKINFHYFAPFFVNYKDETTRDFIYKYRARYNAEPSNYAFRGHDILYYFISVMDDLGKLFVDFVNYYPNNLLQNSFQFERTNEESGLTNKGTRNVHFLPDYSIQVSKAEF